MMFVMITLQWGRNFIVAETRSPACPCPLTGRCFNGAATLSLRKRGCFSGNRRQNTITSMGPQLYRCGNLIHAARYGALRVASMGPQLYRCGNASIRQKQSTWWHSFNGAATLSLRKPVTYAAAGPTYTLLQWGRNFIVAETPTRLAKSKLLIMLQWGRNFIVAETPANPLSDALHPMLQWGRNFIVAETEHVRRRPHRHAVASMGPQLYRCGNSESWLMLSLLKSLQWGRNFIVAETDIPCAGAPTGFVLQWGRNFIVAETRTGALA